MSSGILAGLTLADYGMQNVQSNISMEQELEGGVPWWKKALALPFGVVGQKALNINLGGQLQRQRADAAPLRGVESAGITAAALKEMEAARNIMRQEIGTGVQNIRQRFGQAGTFQSGARGRAEDAFRQQGLGRLSDAFAGIELEAIRARQAGATSTIALQMQEAQFAWNKRQAENAMITQLVTTALPFFMKQDQVTTPSLDPSSGQDRVKIWEDLGLDPFIMESGGGQSPWTRIQ